MDTVIDCLMDSWGALWLWVFATVQDIFILQLTQSWLLAWIISFSDCKYHSLNKYFIRNKPVVGREEEADAQCCVFEDVTEFTEETQRLSMKCARVRQEVFACPGFSAQNNVRNKKKPGGQFISIKGDPIWTKKDVLQCWGHCGKVGFLTNPTLLSPKLQVELSCYKEGSWPRTIISPRKQL